MEKEYIDFGKIDINNLSQAEIVSIVAFNRVMKNYNVDKSLYQFGGTVNGGIVVNKDNKHNWCLSWVSNGKVVYNEVYHHIGEAFYGLINHIPLQTTTLTDIRRGFSFIKKNLYKINDIDNCKNELCNILGEFDSKEL